MINVIGSLRIELPGSTMWSKQECFEQLVDETGKVTTKPIYDKFNHECMTVKTRHYDKKSKKTIYRNEERYIHTRKSKPAIQTIPITEDSYHGMTEDCPECLNPKLWKTMDKNTRLLWNLKAIASDFGGKLLDWYISDDWNISEK